jgi:hypothetical protein
MREYEIVGDRSESLLGNQKKEEETFRGSSVNKHE